MSRRSFDDGHQNQTHAAGFDLTFQVMHDLFHPKQEQNIDPNLVDYVDYAENPLSAAGDPHAAEENAYYQSLEEAEAPNDLGDLVDPQNDTYEEEGTHGLPLLAKAAATGYMKARSNPKTGPVVKAGEQVVIEKGKEFAGKAASTLKDKMAERRGAKSGPSEGGSTPSSDDPFA